MPSSPVLAGSPRFTDRRLQQQAESSGVEAPWRALLQTRGASAFEDVEGDFAVGMEVDDGRVLLGVDRFGIRTLCYRVIGGQLHFAERADELAAIAPAAGVAAQGIFDYLYFHVLPSPRTIFEGVFRLPAGHLAEWSDGTLSIRRYWTPSFEQPASASFDSLKGEFRGLLRTAVERQLDGSKPACFLSGGTDSSTVAGMVGAVAGRAASTFSIGFDAQGYDEMEFARIAARHFGTEHHEYYVSPGDVAAGMPTVAAHYDQPFGNSSAVPAYYCARFAREHGVSKLLAGDGGDELFGGNSRYAKQRIFDWYGHVPGLAKAPLEAVLADGSAGRLPVLRKAASYLQQARVPMPDRLAMYNLLLRTGVERVLQPGFLAQVDAGQPLLNQRAIWQEARAQSSLDRTLAFDWRYTLAEADLPKVVGTTSLAGVDVGFPLLDEQLVAFSTRLPVGYKLKGLKLRWFFKEALRGFLPDETLAKRKQGFGLPFGVWALRDDALRSTSTQALQSLASRGIVKPDFLRTLVDELLPQHPGYYGEMVWILAMLEFWLQAHAPAYRVPS